MSGHVYLLGNIAMPTFFKIGMSGCPFNRARQLSKATGVPQDFDVLCHIQTVNPSEVERHLHQFLADFRHSSSREFFRFSPEHMPWVVGLFKFHPDATSFSLAEGVRRTRYLREEPTNPWATENADGDPEMTEYSPDRVYEQGWTY